MWRNKSQNIYLGASQQTIRGILVTPSTKAKLLLDLILMSAYVRMSCSQSCACLGEQINRCVS
uniref:Uncharacterized protein n=1 Tax=Arundo donax TaxID=35708 RepID=A0A0A8Y603_ARUDO